MLYGYQNNTYTLSGSAAYFSIPSYSISWQGYPYVSAGLQVSGRSTAEILPSTSAAWTTGGILHGSTASIYLEGPVGSAIGFTQDGLTQTGLKLKSIAGGTKVEKLTGIVTSNVHIGMSSYDVNYFTASSKTLALQSYGLDYQFPAYAGVWEFYKSDTNVPYLIDTASKTCTIHGAWFYYNKPSEYEIASGKDVDITGVMNTFNPGVSSTKYTYELQIPIKGNTGSGKLRYHWMSQTNGQGAWRDGPELVDAGALSSVGRLDYDHDLSAYILPLSKTYSYSAGTWNPMRFIGFFIDQDTFSGKWRINGNIRGSVYISGIAP